MVENDVCLFGFVLFFVFAGVQKQFFKLPVWLVCDCCVYKSYRNILNYKASKFFSQHSIRIVYYTVTNV